MWSLICFDGRSAMWSLICFDGKIDAPGFFAVSLLRSSACYYKEASSVTN